MNRRNFINSVCGGFVAVICPPNSVRGLEINVFIVDEAGEVSEETFRHELSLVDKNWILEDIAFSPNGDWIWKNKKYMPRGVR